MAATTRSESTVSADRTRDLLRARDLVDARYADRVTVADMARAAHLSRAHFGRMFRATFGESPHQYLVTRRLERAAALLRDTDWPVTRVCEAVGWASLGSFTTSFTRIHGTTPTTYRSTVAPAMRHLRLPLCVAKAHGRPANRTFREAARPLDS